MAQSSDIEAPRLRAFYFHHKCSVTMRKPNTALIPARNAPQAAKRFETPEELVCLALVFAMFVIAFRIASIW
jgi:hypothetical protein